MEWRIYADFNTMARDREAQVWYARRVLIDPSHYPRHDLQEGTVVILYDETLEVRAVLEYDQEQGRWRARPDRITQRDLTCPSTPPRVACLG